MEIQRDTRQLLVKLVFMGLLLNSAPCFADLSETTPDGQPVEEKSVVRKSGERDERPAEPERRVSEPEPRRVEEQPRRRVLVEERREPNWFRDRLPAEGQIQLSIYYMPAIDLDADKDTEERNQDIDFEESVRNGHGLVFRLGFGSRSTKTNEARFSFGLLYQTSSHKTGTSRSSVYVHSGFLEASGGFQLGNKWLRGYWDGAVGLGGTVVDFKGGLDDSGGAAAMARTSGGLQLFEQIELGAGVGVYIFGYPGETIGRAWFSTMELTLRF